MRFGIVDNTGVVGVDPDHLVAVARHAEAVGVRVVLRPVEVVGTVPEAFVSRRHGRSGCP